MSQSKKDSIAVHFGCASDVDTMLDSLSQQYTWFSKDSFCCWSLSWLGSSHHQQSCRPGTHIMHEYRQCMAADMTISAGVITSRTLKTLGQTAAYHDAPYSGDGVDEHSPFSEARWEMTPVRSSTEWTYSPGNQRRSQATECVQLGTQGPQGSFTCLHQTSLMAKTFALQPSASICCYTQRDCCCLICSTLAYGQAQHGLNIVYPRLHSV